MKEIFRHGFNKRKKINCSWCGCIFSYDETDLIIGVDDKEKYIDCPECRRILKDKDATQL